MAKPLSEHRENVKARKVDTFEPVEGSNLEPVNGGHVRRVVFQGRDPTPDHFEPVEAQERDRVYRPRHDASIADIEREVDNLHRNNRAPTKREPREETVYSTDGGSEVRAATFQFGRKAERVLYTTEDKGHYREERRFNNADVDKVIADVDLEPEVEVIKETKTRVVKRKKKVAKKVPVTKPAKPAKAAKKVTKKPAKKPAKKATLPYDYKGDVHEVVDLEGIGPTYEKKLHKAGISNTQELLFADDAKLEKLTGAKPKTIQNWKDMSQLVKISGIGPQFAELMVRAGVGFDVLKKGTPKDLVAQVKDYESSLKNTVTGSGIGIKRMTAWQDAAKKMRKVPIDLAKIEVMGLESRAARQDAGLDPKGSPLTDPPAEVHCAAYTKAGDACKNTPRGKSKYCASHKGYRPPTKAQLAANAKA